MPSTHRQKSPNNDIILQLIELLNLTEREAELYFEVVRSGPIAVKDLKTRVETPRTRVYTLLKKLQDEGLVIAKSGSPTLYSAVSPMKAIDRLIKREKAELTARDAARRVLADELEAYWTEADTSQQVKPWLELVPFFQAVPRILREIRLARHQLLIAMKSAGGLRDWSASADDLYWQIKNNVDVRFLVNSLEIMKTIIRYVPIAEVRVFEALPQSFVIIDNKAYIFYLRDFDPDGSYVLQSEDKHFILTQNEQFELFWWLASKYTQVTFPKEPSDLTD